MSNNPNDRSGPIQTGQKGKGIILNRQDPLKQNRYLVAMQGMDGEIGQPQWMVVKQQGMATRMLGGTTRYMVGDWVSLEQNGNSGQIFEITGAHENEKQDDQKRDKHYDASSEDPYKVSDGMGPVQTRVWDGWGKPEFSFGSVDMAKAWTNGYTPTPYNPYKGDPVESAAKETPTSQKYGRNSPRVPPEEQGLGTEKYPKADPKKADKDLESAGVPETVKNAYKMVDNLRKTVEGGMNPQMPDSVGGMGNIMGALSAIASLFAAAQNTQQQKQENKTIMETTLRNIYKAETGKDPLDIFGKETLDYKTWRTNYLTTHNLTEIYDAAAS